MAELAGLDIAHSSVSASRIKALHRCELLEKTEKIVIVGGPGTGRIHLACAMRVQATIEHHLRLRILSTVELINELELEMLKGIQGRAGNRMTHADLVFLDEIGYLPFSQIGGALLFHSLSRLYYKKDLIIITDLSFTEWPTVFGEPELTTALLERLTHLCLTIEIGNDNFRMKNSMSSQKETRTKLSTKT